MTDHDGPDAMLPGLDFGLEHGTPASPLRASVEATITALHDDGLLEPRHVAYCQLALELADAVTAGRRSGRASAVAMAAAQLRETLAALPEPAQRDAAQAFADWLASEGVQP